jgi:predicted O-methyltransferase YrrM
MEKISSIIKEITKLEKDLLSEQESLLRGALSILEKKIKTKDAKTIKFQQDIVAKQDEHFSLFRLDRQEAIQKLNKVLNRLIGRDYNLSDSEHWLLFAAIANAKTNCKKILEIGTANGVTAAILSLLFPKAEITTIDLPRDSEKFRSTYDRAKVADEVAQKRDLFLKDFPNINFIELNSIFLDRWEKNSFDLIWVDGAHGYPVLPIDLYNSCRLIKNDGLVIIDDVFLRLRKSDETYRSIAAVETLKLFKETGMIKDFKLIRKRLSLSYNFKDLNEKFLGIFEA